MATFIKLVSGKFPFAKTYAAKNRPKKYLCIATNTWIVSAFRWSVKYFFAQNSPLFRKSRGERRRKKGIKGNFGAFSFQVNVKSNMYFCISLFAFFCFSCKCSIIKQMSFWFIRQVYKILGTKSFLHAIHLYIWYGHFSRSVFC